MSSSDPHMLYEIYQRRQESWRRASNYLVLLLLGVIIAGLGVGLYPEMEKKKESQRRVVEAKSQLTDLKREAETLRRRVVNLANDPEAIEDEAREHLLRLKREDEDLLLIPDERKARYEE